MKDQSIRIYAMFHRLATAMYPDLIVMRGWVAHKMTNAFYEKSGSVTDKFIAAFKAENLDFLSAVKSLNQDNDNNPEWQTAMAVIYTMTASK